MMAPIPFDEKLLCLELEPGTHAVFTEATPRLLIDLIDLTSLRGDDDGSRIAELCLKANASQVPAVCIFPVFVPLAKEILSPGIKVATVAAGFPDGLGPLRARVAEVAECVALGADEIDVVIRRDHANLGRWWELYEELVVLRGACQDRTLKVILATGELRDREVIRQAALVAMMAGADFVKTSTGREKVNATLEAGEVMCSAIKIFEKTCGRKVGLKPAGGIQTRETAEAWWNLVGRILGPDWLNSGHFRIGASSLLDNLETPPKVESDDGNQNRY